MTTVRITAVCPPDLQSDAAQFAMVAADTPLAADTYSRLTVEDAGGNRFALASFVQPMAWVSAMEGVLPAPAFPVDMTAATRAQAALRVWTPADGLPAPTPGPGVLVAVIGPSAPEARRLLGLSQIEVGE